MPFKLFRSGTNILINCWVNREGLVSTILKLSFDTTEMVTYAQSCVHESKSLARVFPICKPFYVTSNYRVAVIFVEFMMIDRIDVSMIFIRNEYII